MAAHCYHCPASAHPTTTTTLSDLFSASSKHQEGYSRVAPVIGTAEIYPPVAEELVRVFNKAAPELYLTCYDDGTVGLSHISVSDPHQKWIVDRSWGSKLEDAAGHPAFALINKANGRALRHGHSECDKVDTLPFNKNEFEDDLLWSASQDFGQNYRTIRMYNNIAMNLDVENAAAQKKFAGVRPGSSLMLFRWLKDQDHQLWRIVPV